MSEAEAEWGGGRESMLVGGGEGERRGGRMWEEEEKACWQVGVRGSEGEAGGG